ncbi:MAG: hypothetical protein LUD00_13350 [Prevotellaceae bacterium]|nr:hypothetical protein [Prevotellaceae bacterium]
MKIKTSLLIALIGIIISACSNPIKKELEKIQENMPMSTDMGSVLGIAFEDNDTVGAKLFMLGGDDIFPDVLASNPAMAKSNFSELLCDTIFQPLLSSLVNENLGLRIYIKGVSALNENNLTEYEFDMMPNEIDAISKKKRDKQWEAILYLAAYKNYIWAHKEKDTQIAPASMTIDNDDKVIKYKYIIDDFYFKDNLLSRNLDDKNLSPRLIWSLLKMANNSTVHETLAEYGFDIYLLLEDRQALKK